MPQYLRRFKTLLQDNECLDDFCAHGIWLANNSGQFCSLAVLEGDPVISYWVVDNESVNYLRLY